MKIAKVILEETMNKIGGFKDKDHSEVSFIISKGALTMLVRNETDYAMRKIPDVEGIEEMESFSVEIVELMNVLGFSDCDSVDFKFIENKIQIQSGIINVKVGRGEITKVTKTESKDKATYSVDADVFNNAITLASNAVDIDSTVIGCVSVDVKEKKAKVQALDGIVGIFDYFNIETDKDFTIHIPKEKIQLFRGMTGEYKGIYDISNQIWIAGNGEYMFSIKLKDFKFSDYRTLLDYGDSLSEMFDKYDVVLNITKDELSKCVNLFKGMKSGVFAKFEKTSNKYTLTCTTDERTVTVELQGKAVIKGEMHLFYFDINKIKWIQHLKENMLFLFFKKYISTDNHVIDKVIPYNSADGQFDDISKRKVGMFLPVKRPEVDSFYKALESENMGEQTEEDVVDDEGVVDDENIVEEDDTYDGDYNEEE